MQGVIRREWHVLFKDDNAADGCFSARPKGTPQIPQSCVAILANGATIACELRLVLENLGDSDSLLQYRTLHYMSLKPKPIQGSNNSHAITDTPGIFPFQRYRDHR